MSVFVLVDCSDNQICHDVIGVFDHAEIGDHELVPYFGKFTRTSFTTIQDSGIEWDLRIDTEYGDSIRLMLHEYTMNEI